MRKEEKQALENLGDVLLVYSVIEVKRFWRRSYTAIKFYNPGKRVKTKIFLKVKYLSVYEKGYRTYYPNRKRIAEVEAGLKRVGIPKLEIN